MLIPGRRHQQLTWNRIWTFRGQRGHIAYQGLRFFVVSVVALAANEVLLTAFVAFGFGKVVAQAIAVVLVMPINFVGNKLWSFRGLGGLTESVAGAWSSDQLAATSLVVPAALAAVRRAVLLLLLVAVLAAPTASAVTTPTRPTYDAQGDSSRRRSHRSRTAPS